ncbi:MAG TPA: sigma-54 dependent transcriptional regulator [Pyrinomonadaceae bacterium]|nr:sigma-54 dependent transcriptional regulator [Pyrinomonadaceae bacterium]
MLALPRVSAPHLDSLLETLRPTTQPILVVIDAQPEDASQLTRPGIADFIIPPITESEVLLRIRRLLNQVRQERKTTQALTEKLSVQQLLGKHPVFLAELNKIPVVAKSDISVLISGETGTGKEMVARVIHYLSPRAGKCFVPLNCGAIPVELLENELFGHENGAYTGASGARIGLIQEADKGTLFLDEVDSLPALAQVKLLRFLQDHEYRPLGSTKIKKGDVRVVAASNANLEHAVAAGTLRRDLYYRLNVVPIVLPPLRERASDILLLAHHFLELFAKKLNSPARSFSPEAERKLLLYKWPGNVRELEHVIERVVVLASQRVIDESQISFPGDDDNLTRLSFKELKSSVIAEFETKYLKNLLIAYRGNISKAAQAAKKERRTFWELLRKHQINIDDFKPSAARE